MCQVEKPDDELHHFVKEYFSLDFLGGETLHEDKRAIEILENTARFTGETWEVGLLWKIDQLSYVNSYATALC